MAIPLLQLWQHMHWVEAQGPRDPGPSPACPADMRLIEGHHYAEVEHLCVDWHPGPERCWAYYPELTLAHGKRKPMRFCMDIYEAPNEAGKRPLVMHDFNQAQAFCEKRGKRICSEFEWETACESPDERPWFYGWTLDTHKCISDKRWKPANESKLSAGGKVAAREAARMWQGEQSGNRPACRSASGIYDLMGNVEEWVSSSRRRKHQGVLMGGFWAKPWTGCRGTNDSHGANFAFYEVGFRCCKAAQQSAP